jgi:hypothetical protein
MIIQFALSQFIQVVVQFFWPIHFQRVGSFLKALVIRPSKAVFLAGFLSLPSPLKASFDEQKKSMA